MDINDIIKVVYTNENDKLVIRKHVADIIKNKIGSISTNLSGLGVIVEIKGNMIALDTSNFVDYIIDNLDELVTSYNKSKEED